MNSPEMPQNEYEKVPGLITEEEGRRAIFEMEGKEPKPEKVTYTGKRPKGFMGEKETTKDVAKKMKFQEYRDKMKDSSPEKLKSFMSFCEQGMEEDKAYKDEYRDLQREAGELMLAKLKIAKESHDLNLKQGLIDIETLRNLFGARLDELKAERDEFEEEGNSLETQRKQAEIKKFTDLIENADNIEKVIRT
ncbi:MAG: hypothetical protein NTX00_03210 [Candidatus Parcubacteria bacterium]|nr:hypothetical protein [Candidatus Parcubacteria bacterium]